MAPVKNGTEMRLIRSPLTTAPATLLQRAPCCAARPLASSDAVGVDRHEPHPDLSRLPAYLWRRSSRAAKVAVSLVVCAGVALGIALAPGIRESKQERARSEEQAAARQRAERMRKL